LDIKHPDAYQQNLLLASLPASDLALLKPGLVQTELKQGTLLHDLNDDIETVYFPQSGMASLLAVMADGAAIEVATVGREGIVGAMTGIGFNRASTRAVVQIHGHASKISARLFEAAVRQSATLRELIIRHKEALLVQVQNVAACNALHKVEARFCRWILQSSDHLKNSEINLTQEFLAEMLGVNRTTVTLVAQTLQKAGLIRYKRGHILIVDRAGLEDMACECYRTIQERVAEILRS
jgi:CRP-like cAMP-binding protein